MCGYVFRVVLLRFLCEIYAHTLESGIVARFVQAVVAKMQNVPVEGIWSVAIGVAVTVTMVIPVRDIGRAVLVLNIIQTVLGAFQRFINSRSKLL